MLVAYACVFLIAKKGTLYVRIIDQAYVIVAKILHCKALGLTFLFSIGELIAIIFKRFV